VINLNRLVRRRADERGEAPLYTFLHEGEKEGAHLTAGELDRRARGIAAALSETCAPGDLALLLFPAGLDFIAAFFGCLYAGVIAVPAYPPHPRRGNPRLAAIARSARPATVLTTAELLAATAQPVAAQIPELAPARWLAADALPEIGPGPDEPELAFPPETPTFLQYTSGSTSTPKGVIVTHGNLLHNEGMIQQAFGQGPSSVVVGWLPLYHDMGLIGNVLQPLYSGGSCVLMPPVAFLQRPRRWLEAITRYRGTTSGGPNFAYELCVQKIAPAEREGLDLSTWEVAFNGAEPVRAETLDRFAEAFAPHGFRRAAFYPCYGLAEATLFVTGPRRGEAPAPRAFDAGALESHQAHEVDAGAEGARRLVGCGHAWSGQRLFIADPETGAELPEGEVGEIRVSGPSVAAGYWGLPEETRATFGSAGPDERLLRTGDLGFLDGGELFVTGRLKDLIILRGRNHYPQDIELTVERSHPALRPGCGASFSVDVDGEERLVVLQELERRAPEPEVLFEAIRQGVAREHEVGVHEVVLLRIGGVLKTSSGKVQRRACRAAYLAGELPVVARSVLTVAAGGGEEAGPPPEPETLAALPPEERAAAIAELLRAEAARVLSVPRSRLDPGLPLTALGLDSLSAAELQQAVETRLGLTLGLADLLQGVTLAELAGSIVGRMAERPEERQPADAQAVMVPGERYPLSHGQRALWFLQSWNPAGAAYNLAAAAWTPSPLDPDALSRALTALVARHAPLRARFGAQEGEPFQEIAPGAALDFAAEDAPGLDGEELLRRLRSEAFRPFDLAAGPLLRAQVYRTAPDRHVLLLAIHHIVADFTSVAVLLRELDRLYLQETGAAEPAALPPLAGDYLGYVRWQERHLASAEGERDWLYWRERLGGELPLLALSTDRPRPPVLSDRGGARSLRLGPAAAGRLRELARTEGVTLFTTLLAAFELLLHRHTGQLDLLVGSPVAGRVRPAFAELVGYCVQTVVLRSDLGGEPAVGELLRRTRDVVAGALEHQGFPLAQLAERLQPGRDLGRSPLFQAMLVLHRGQPTEGRATGLAEIALGEGGARLELGGMELASISLEEHRAQLELTLAAAETGDDFVLALQHSLDLFDPASIARMLGQLEVLLAGLAGDARRPVRDLPLLTAAEQAEILAASQGPGLRWEGCLHDRFVARAAASPEVEALVAGAERLTYGELNRRASRLAHRLRRLGVSAERTVGVHLERSADLIVSLLAVLKAGGAYVPLDPAYPGERLAWLMADARADVLITREALLERLPRRPVGVVLIDAEREALDAESSENPPPAALPESLAYLIYTSGSTGRPKGVAIAHRNAASFVHWARQVFTDSELAGVLAATSVGFDLSVFELFVPLSWGGRVILAANALALPSLPAAAEVTLVNTVPSAIAELLEHDGLLAGRTVNLAGEPLATALARRLHEAGIRRLLNLYGPSETTTYSTFAVLPPEAEGAPSIGAPLAGTRVYLLDGQQRLAPAGAVGEILIGGAGVARGYHGRPELTAERFVPDQFSEVPGERLYRTGDLARRRPSGELDFLGRHDHQVKVRGFRIELGEIEAALESLPAVRQAVVLAREAAPGDKRLAAYLTSTGEPTAAAELRAHLARTLPEPMIPAAFVWLEAFPLTPHGKVDRGALPAPDWAAEGRSGEALPRSPLEELLAGIWADVLGVERVGVDDDFFALGGHSLLASRLLARVQRVLGVTLPLSDLFQAPTVAALAGRIGPLAGAEPPPAAIPREEPLPLSFAQQRLWFLHRLEPESPAYNVPGALRLTGPLWAPALAAALREVVRRHESLRTGFPAAQGEPRQEIAPAVVVTLAEVDLSALEEEARSAAVEVHLKAEAGRPFDLARPPLLRAFLLRLAGDEHVLLLVLHHIVSDGLSLQVLFREVATLYAAAVEDRPSTLPEPPQYADFALWQRRSLSGERLARLLAYWRERLAGLSPLTLPIDRLRRAVSTPPAASHRIELPAELLARLRAVSRARGATPFMTLLGGVTALLARYSGQDDFAVGTPVASRDRVETEGIVGLLVNTLVLRADLGDDPTTGLLLQRLREVVLSAHVHQDLPFERLVEELQPERSLDRPPLFQVMAAFFNTAGVALALPRMQAELLDVDNGAAKLDLTLMLREETDRLRVAFVYRRDLFEPATVERMGRHLERLLAGIAGDPGARVSALPLLTEAEARQLFQAWSPAAIAAPAGRTVHELFEEQARRTPDRPAVAFRDEVLTYALLSRRSGALARELRALGVGPEVVVGLCVERSVEAIVGILGVLKAGGAYLPLDPEYPRERLAFLLEDSRASVLLTQRRVVPRIPPGAARIVLLDELAAEGEAPPGGAGPDNLAYVIYTSGSTGRPKGTLIEHRSVVNLAHALRLAVYGERPAPLRVSVNASLAFDASVKQIVQLLHGHVLHVLPEEVRRDGERLLAFLRERPLDVLDCTPSQLSLLLAAGLLDAGEISPALALVGGEAIGGALWERLAADRRTAFFNVYGPTECTVDTTACRIGESPDRPVLGRPLANVQLRILDRRLVPVPAGVPGELCVAGAGIARGYLDRPALTAERFVPDPESPWPGGRMYRTGDLVRHLPDGRLEYIGRADHQVKVRGHRVELGEIAAGLERHPTVGRAVAVLREDTPGDQRLVAYFTGEETVADSELRSFLRAELPDAMVPSAFVRLDRLPLSAHGKVDRASLPPPDAALERDYLPPRTPLERTLAGIWAELLRLEQVGVQDNFFELGGHSLLALQLIARIRQATGVETPVRALFESPTVAALATVLERSAPAAPRPALGPVRRGERNLGQLMAEIGRLSPEEARRRLAGRGQED